MMRTLWRKSRSGNLVASSFGWLTFLLITVALLAFWGRGLIIRLVAPLWRTERVLTVESQMLATAGLSRNELIRRNSTLKLELETLRALRLERAILEIENRKLRQRLGASDLGLQRKAVAYVLSRERASLYDVIVIDLGRDNSQDLAPGDLVLADQQLILGEVVEVFARQSKVKLLSAPDRRLPISIGTSGLLAEAEGLGNGNFKVRLPKGVTITIGDYVRLSSYSARFLLGEVIEVKEDPALPFVEVFFQTPINLSNLELVEIYAP